jgi:class 3 adenylate cyclase
VEPPPVQYAHTADGLNIAYTDVGEGDALILLPLTAFGHQQMQWDIPEYREWLSAIGRGRRLVTYDSRGTGLSSRRIDHSTFEDWLADLDAVVSRLGLRRFVLGALNFSAMQAVGYALAHPEAVAGLILWAPILDDAAHRRRSATSAMRQMAQLDWDVYADLSGTAFGFESQDGAKAWAEMVRQSGERAGYIMAVESFSALNLMPEAARLRVSALIFHNRQNRFVQVETVQQIAATIPQARLLMLEHGVGHVLGDLERQAAAIDSLFASAFTPSEVEPEPAAPVFRTILFTDLEGHTPMMSRLGDARGREVLREHERLTREALAAHGGQEVKTMGDGFMASFGSAQKAIDCAIALQRAVQGGIAGQQLRIRAGINAGEPIAEDDDLFGSSVIAAARIASKAEGGQVLVADVVRQLVAGKGFLFHDTGLHDLRGLEEPVRIWELKWEGA